MLKCVMDTHIIVIGAGVIGLTTALALKRSGYKNVTIVAKYIPGDKSIEYTSPFAGAHWRTMAPNDNSLLQKFDTVSYNIFMKMAGEQGIDKQSGIMLAQSDDFFDNDTLPEVTNPWHKDVVYNFEFLPTTGLPKGAKVGHRYTTVLINSPVYLQWLMKEFKKLGGKIIQHALTHIDEITGFAQDQKKIAVINCTGLGAKFLGGVNDDALFPTRGQTVIVDAPYIKRTLTHLHADGSITYVIPRSDGTLILGGTATKGDYNAFVDEPTVHSILRRTRTLCPEITENRESLKIVGHGVGLRPYRVGGPRFENEVKNVNGVTVYITHAYGHGGFGYQSSWGSAFHTIELMEQQHGLLKFRSAL